MSIAANKLVSFSYVYLTIFFWYYSVNGAYGLGPQTESVCDGIQLVFGRKMALVELILMRMVLGTHPQLFRFRFFTYLVILLRWLY